MNLLSLDDIESNVSAHVDYSMLIILKLQFKFDWSLEEQAQS